MNDPASAAPAGDRAKAAGQPGVHWSRKLGRVYARVRSKLARRLMPLGAVAGTLALFALLYLGYDLAQSKISPCEAIFRESALGLKTKISFLKTEGELQIGREQLTELDERAQMAALNLKTCCTVLDAGRLDPEQFLQCKGSARSYETHLAELADLVRQAVREGITTSAIADSHTASNASASDAAAAPVPSAPPATPQIKEQIDKQVAAARDVSRNFNREVVAVRKEQAVAQLQAVPPQQVEIEAKEREPNDDGLTTNGIALDAWITAAIGTGKDADYFAFTTPETYRDVVRVELKNRSTTLEPRIELFDGERTSRGAVHKTTHGADLAYEFVAAPDTPYLVRVSNYYGDSTGVYLLRVRAMKAYDMHEPNDDILHAKPIAPGKSVEAQIMDKADVDFFTFRAGASEGRMQVAVENRSTSLQPEIAVYDSAKALIGSANNTTAGGNASFSFKAKPDARYYLRVRDYYSSAAGAYSLTVAPAPPGDG